MLGIEKVTKKYEGDTKDEQDQREIERNGSHMGAECEVQLPLQKEESDSPFFDSAVKASARSQNEDEGLAHEEEDYIEGVDISVPVLRRTATPFIPPSQDLKTSSNSEDTSSTEELDDFCYSELNREEVLRPRDKSYWSLSRGR